MRQILILLILIGPLGAFAQTDDDAVKSDPAESDASGPVIILPTIEAEAERLKIKPRYTFRGESIRSATGSGGDPIRVLNRLPSVGVLNDFVGVLSVRGGGPEDNLYYFDRLPLGYPYHLQGIVSTVNAEVIEKVEVYPGGYGAEFGSNSQAVIDIYSRTKDRYRFRRNSQSQSDIFSSLPRRKLRRTRILVRLWSAELYGSALWVVTKVVGN